LSLELVYFLAVFLARVSIRSSLRTSWISAVLDLSEKRLIVLKIICLTLVRQIQKKSRKDYCYNCRKMTFWLDFFRLVLGKNVVTIDMSQKINLSTFSTWTNLKS